MARSNPCVHPMPDDHGMVQINIQLRGYAKQNGCNRLTSTQRRRYRKRLRKIVGERSRARNLTFS